ncbi:MAG: histidine phosphatase family protein [Cryomorphaceae bacterium]
MKTIYLHRHAKSSWDHGDLTDFERPLNDRGMRDAPAMGRRLKESGDHIDAIVSSPAERAFTTARAVAGALDLSETDILQIRSLYLPSVENILEVINKLNENWDSVMLFGHNPGFTDAVGYFTGEYLDNLPTAGVAKIEFPFDSWDLVSAGTGRFVSVNAPKDEVDG